MAKDRIEQAYETLGLDNGASIAEIDEAAERLLRQWHPDLFPYSRKLQEKSQDKQKEIQDAVEILRRHYSNQGDPKGTTPQGTTERFEKPKADLFEETISERLRRRRKPHLAWLGIGAFFVLGFAFTYLGRPVEDDRPLVPKMVFPPTEPLGEVSEDRAADRQPADRPSNESTAKTERTAVPEEPSPPQKSQPQPRQEQPETVQSRPKPELLRELVQTDSPPAEKSDSDENRNSEDEEARKLSEQAFQLLKEKSLAAANLVSGRSAEYDFQDWTVVKQEPHQVWIDVTAVKASGPRQFHFIWAVDLQRQTVRPLSQAARDLEQAKIIEE